MTEPKKITFENYIDIVLDHQHAEAIQLLNRSDISKVYYSPSNGFSYD